MKGIKGTYQSLRLCAFAFNNTVATAFALQLRQFDSPTEDEGSWP